MSKPTKRIMHSFKLAEISAVDKPAQEGAVAVLIKSATEQVTAVQMPVAKDGYMFTPVMTTATEGHSHIIQIHDDCSSGYTDGAAITGATDQYGSQVYLSHPWLKTDTGIVIGESQGHTHLIEAVSDVAAVATTTTEEDMTTKAQEVTKSEADDAVVYTTADGAVFHKSDDPRLVAMAKTNDDLTKRAADAEAKFRKADLMKRGVELMPNLPGTDEFKGVLLGAIEQISDEEMRKQAYASLKAGSHAMEAAFKRSGTNDAETDANAAYLTALNKFASAQGKLPGVAMIDFNKTTEGAELYQAARS